MKVTFLTTRQIKKKLHQLMNEFDEFFWAVAWGSNGPLADKLLFNANKIQKILIGIHFSQTDPKLLDRLANNPGVRVAPTDGKGIFHPKAYHFQSGNKAASIIGSANFTKSGMTNNVESAVLLEGNCDSEPFLSIKSLIESQWAKGRLIDDEFLASYKLKYIADKPARRKLNKPLRIHRASDNAVNPDLLTKTWREYVKTLKTNSLTDFDNRLVMLRKAHLVLNRATAFSGLSDEERKAIAGTVGPKELLGNDLDDIDWQCFGSMFPAGKFKNRIAENDQNISIALERIPPSGEVSQEDYTEFVKHFLRAFENSKIRGSYASASRLLSMKRPDYFICVNKKNIGPLSGDLGFARTTLTFERYWTDIVEPITQSTWWQKQRPSGRDGQIWDGRVAMLDAIYYEPD